MARIAVGGFHHETNCFVQPSTDFVYFAAHRDRPPLVRGPEVIEWLGNTSFALSGFLSEMGKGHEYVPLGQMVELTDFEPLAQEILVVVAPADRPAP